MASKVHKLPPRSERDNIIHELWDDINKKNKEWSDSNRCAGGGPPNCNSQRNMINMLKEGTALEDYGFKVRIMNDYAILIDDTFVVSMKTNKWRINGCGVWYNRPFGDSLDFALKFIFESNGKFKPMKIKRTKETIPNYNVYLVSKWWKERKKSFAKKYKRKCGICGAGRGKLNLHHLTYDNIGNEKDTDLVWLCSCCHTFVHDGREDDSLAKRYKK